jgi:BCD family chlorophyll transporter-like MFS transporter
MYRLTLSFARLSCAAYGAVYHLEILLLFISLIALGPVVRKAWQQPEENKPFGLADFPA